MQQPTTSEWIEVKNSRIHGKGIFAAKDIPKGTKIIEYVGEKVTKKESDNIADRDTEKHEKNKEEGAVYLFELNKKYDLDGNVEWNTARLINHSCNPNCETEGDDQHIWITAMQDIKKGEELSYDYCYDLENWQDHPCKCGAPQCLGYVIAKKHRGKFLKKLRWKKKKTIKKT